MISVQKAIEMAPRTSLRIGGTARYLCEVQSGADMAEALRRAAADALPVLIIGNGTNLLISDQGWSGMVISTAGMNRPPVWDGTLVECDAGVMLPALVRQCIRRGCAGLECLGGIPGTVGGAVMMNAGAWGQTIGARVQRVSYVDSETGRTAEAMPQELAFDYRTSSLKNRSVAVVSAVLGFIPGDPQQLELSASAAMQKRRDQQPLDTRNCGSVFRNPEGASAGALIDQCGLKGFRVGEVAVSEKHANFIINAGGGRAADFRRVVIHVQRTVWENKGVKLVPEVEFAGTFDDELLFA